MSTSKLPSLPVERLLKRSPAIAGGVPEGLDALLLGELARHARDGGAVLHVARDANRLATLEEAIPFFAPDIEVLSFPAWDGVPYDRVAPNAETIAERIATLAALIDRARARNEAARRPDHDQCRSPARAAARFHRRIEREPSCRQRHQHADADRAARGVRLCALRHGGRSRPIRGARRHSRSLILRAASRSVSTSSATRSNRSGPSSPRRNAPRRGATACSFCP